MLIFAKFKRRSLLLVRWQSAQTTSSAQRKSCRGFSGWDYVVVVVVVDDGDVDDGDVVVDDDGAEVREDGASQGSGNFFFFQYLGEFQISNFSALCDIVTIIVPFRAPCQVHHQGATTVFFGQPIYSVTCKGLSLSNAKELNTLDNK